MKLHGREMKVGDKVIVKFSKFDENGKHIINSSAVWNFWRGSTVSYLGGSSFYGQKCWQCGDSGTQSLAYHEPNKYLRWKMSERLVLKPDKGNLKCIQAKNTL